MENKVNNQMTFKNKSQLANWLKSKGLDLSTWGKGSAKTVQNLWHELTTDNVILCDKPVLRIVQAVRVIIRDGDKILIEKEQLLNDNRRRKRNHPPSEKMKPGENYRQAALRCLYEELGIPPERIKLLPNTHQMSQHLREALSYPGLQTQYLFHSIEAQVSNLPKHDFDTTELTDPEKEAVKYHTWSWQPAPNYLNA